MAIQFVQGQFVDHYEPTIENTFNKKLQIRGNEYSLFLVDTAGQDEYTIFPPEYSVDIHAYILVYSIDSAKSFEVCRVIHDKLHDLVGIRNVPMVLVGNKTDLHMDRCVTTEEGKALAEEMKAVFLETSAKENRNVGDVFLKLVSEMEKIDGEMPEDKKCIIS